MLNRALEGSSGAQVSPVVASPGTRDAARSSDLSGQLGRDQEVAQAEAAVVSRQCRCPVRIHRQVGLGIAGNDSDQHLADDPSANRPELLAAVLYRRFAQYVEPQRSFAHPSIAVEAEVFSA